jgi:hypothetical protein
MPYPTHTTSHGETLACVMIPGALEIGIYGHGSVGSLIVCHHEGCGWTKRNAHGIQTHLAARDALAHFDDVHRGECPPLPRCSAVLHS